MNDSTGMTGALEIHDPLTINLRRQTTLLLSQIPDSSPHAAALRKSSTRAELLDTLSRLLYQPSLTNAIAIAFRPLLLDLCARWLHDDENAEEKFDALCLLFEIHQEIYPVFAAFVRGSGREGGPLAFLAELDTAESVDFYTLHRKLLAYYRILQANRTLPETLDWSLASLLKLISPPHPDSGVRFLAIRCYALQSGMMEGERVKMEKQIVGDVEEVDCMIDYGANLDGTRLQIDGWVMPAMEVGRVAEARNSHLAPQDYYSHEESDSQEPIHPAELSPLIVNVHGILMLRSSITASPQTTLVETPTTVQSLRTLAVHHSLRVPTLLTSAPSCGKSLLLSHLAAALHPEAHNQIVNIHLADTSLDPRSLLGSYVSSPIRPGTFEWREGVLPRAMREGKWVVFEDIDRASGEVLGVIKPLIESLGLDKWIGGRASLDIPGRGRVEADDNFAIYATRSAVPSRSGMFASSTFYGSHKFHEMIVPSPTAEDLRMMVEKKFPTLAGAAGQGLLRLWDAVRALGSAPSMREIGLRELDKLCVRISNLLPTSQLPMDIDIDTDRHMLLPLIFTNPTLIEDIYLEARDVFFGAGVTTASARSHTEAVAAVVAEHLGLSPERRDWLLHARTPEFDTETDVNGRTIAVRIGRTRLRARDSKSQISAPAVRPFALHRPAKQLLSRIATAVSLNEPVLLTGETGTGKTSAVMHLASLLNRPLISLNLSNQTESSDLIGGFKPVDARIPSLELQERFSQIFERTFSRKKNTKFEDSVRKAVQDGKWKRAVGLWRESAKLAREKLQVKLGQEQSAETRSQDGIPRKRRKLEQESLHVSAATWDAFERDVRVFEVQHVQGNGKFAFAFVEGLLVKALRSGDWILLDEVNLANPETLESISTLLQGPSASITLTEQGSLEPVPRHPDFRLFACMNPATDVGKRDLPPNIRSRFTEIDVPPPDDDRETLLSIIDQYIGGCAVGDRGVIMDVAEFYTAVKRLMDERKIADGSNHRPHYSMRTLARALTFTVDMVHAFPLRRALWEGCLMTFTMVLDPPSAAIVIDLAHKHLLARVRNPRSLLAKEATAPQPPHAYVKFGPFYLERGPLPEDLVENYIMTPSVETKLVDLARIIAARRFPVLIEGPTSSGKTSSIEYLAKRTGHRFVRINNHEHTDIQEYLGTYVSDPSSGKLVFRDGLLVRALRNGDWIVLDELNLAPTDVLEALNRLLDDNRELVIPETQEVVRPHPHFMLFATQNPSGLYAGRKVLSRAFRNRFLEVHFEDVPKEELENILCQRCRIAPSYGHRIVSVFVELQKRRQTGRVFESKHSFATLRDLFRWAQRDALNYQELAENGFMLLAERTRREDDRNVVREVIESIMKVRIDEKNLYNLHRSGISVSEYLGCPVPSTTQLVWTSAMQRLFILIARALRFNEPVLLVGETGCGKTSVCQLYADILSKPLQTVNCHQNTETADLIGGLRPIRNRAAVESDTFQHSVSLLKQMGFTDYGSDSESLISFIDRVSRSQTLDPSHLSVLQNIRTNLQKLSVMFEWHDGPLIEAMRHGNVFLLDEISLADDSVLERLNSVLEPERTIVLAERGGDNVEDPSIQAVNDFKVVATMNPGGDYGKKELSPALRNRFTEIWVPPLSERQDIECIIDALWQSPSLKVYTPLVLDFVEWLSIQAADRSLSSIRDILAWVQFSNTAYSLYNDIMSTSQIFHHAAHMTYLDGLGSLPQFAAFSHNALDKLRSEALSKLEALVPISGEKLDRPIALGETTHVRFGSFSVPRGSAECHPNTFSLQAPTTQDNVMRVIRACQLQKPVLLEGSPGVGKTSLVMALANICGYKLCRINLSDQTDLSDLFGSDLPVEGGHPGQFAWKDAEFLRALQEGHWVLLDEMNLAPQAILEGLNAVLDHRGTVYIPELGRSFTRHPSFRIFAAQNPLQQGGGRKGLPKSFLNRFTKVYVQELTPNDILLVCRNLFTDLPEQSLRNMIEYTARLHDEVMTRRSFATEGAPWEFNLRDVIRWGMLMQKSGPGTHPVDYLATIFLERFRNVVDRQEARTLFQNIFIDYPAPARVRLLLSPTQLKLGHFYEAREGRLSGHRPGRILQARSVTLETIVICCMNNWLTILTGPRDSGKTSSVRLMAQLCGRSLEEISINNATDAADLLGGFEEVDANHRARMILQDVLSFSDEVAVSANKWNMHTSRQYHAIKSALRRRENFQDGLEAARALVGGLAGLSESACRKREILIHDLMNIVSRDGQAGRFEWVDGPLVRALKDGLWLLLDGANMCNASVLDRLNSLCETNGVLVLNERGQVGGEVQVIKPHPDFRLFMSVEPHQGELSRAMRNRGIEIALVDDLSKEDHKRVLDHNHLPTTNIEPDLKQSSLLYELARRGAPTLRQADPSQSDLYSHGRLAGEDCPTSWLADLIPPVFEISPVRSVDSRIMTYFVASSTIPVYLGYLRRFLIVQSNVGYSRTITSFVDSLPETRLFQTLCQYLRDHAQVQQYPIEILLSQPLDVTLIEPRILEHGRMLEVYMHALRLLVTLHLDQGHKTEIFNVETETSTLNTRRSATNERNVRVATATNRLLETMRDTSQKLLGGTHMEIITMEAQINIMQQLLAFGRRLRDAVSLAPLDYSAIQVIVQWIWKSLEGYPDVLENLVLSARTLKDAIVPTSGLGLTEMWTSLNGMNITDIRTAQIQRLEVAARKTDDHENGLARLSRVLEVMAIWALPNVPSLAEEEELSRTTQQLLEVRSLGDLRTSPYNSVSQRDDLALVIELNVIHRVQVAANRELPQSCVDTLEHWISYGLRHLLLSPLVPYRQLLWASNASEPGLLYVARAQMQWLEAIWHMSSVTRARGPSTLLLPLELNSTIAECDLQPQSLRLVGPYQRSLLRHIEIFSMPSLLGHITRIEQLSILLLQAVHMVSSSLGGSNNDEEPNQEVFSIPSTLAVLEDSRHMAFSKASRRLLRPALERLWRPHHSTGHMSQDLGWCWIALGTLILELYVPDTPIDPAAMQRYSDNFWREERAMFASQIKLHEQFEIRTSGPGSSLSIPYLLGLSRYAEDHISNKTSSSSSSRPDIAQMHAFWTEVLQFMTQVISPLKIEAIISDLQSQAPHSTMREQGMQESIDAFGQRIRMVYPAFSDISGPIQLALLQIKLGLRLSADGFNAAGLTSNGQTEVVAAMVSIPSVRSVDALRDVSATVEPSPVPSISLLLVHLAGMALDVSLGVAVESHMERLEDAYEQIFSLWSIERARAEEAEREGQSLYRQSALEHSAITEADLEEEEFLSMFPQFEDLLEAENSYSSNAGHQQKRVPLFGPRQIIRIGELHLCLLGGNWTSTQHVPALFLDIRRSLVTTIMQSSANNLSESLDLSSRPFQMGLLHDRLFELRGSSSSQNVSYNFYLDANIPEIRKASDMLSVLRGRLDALINEWPDQMVLQHLRTRCDIILNFDLSSPVHKVLSALEHLLFQVEDWEMYSNRENTLRSYQQSIIALVIEWRRLELASWRDLLQTQAVTFANGAFEWWFRLYEAIIRGVVSAVNEEDEGRVGAIDQYLDGLVPLIDEFLSSSPLGQYQARLQLLASFATYAHNLAKDKWATLRSALKHVHRILHFTERYHRQFAPGVRTTLSNRQNELEKEIRDFIKLASWKDVNVHALKQSAQKTHRQLYKSIRKFREAMRQPVADFLKLPTEEASKAEPSERPRFEFTALRPAQSLFPQLANSSSMPPHLANLERTYKNFEALVVDRITPWLRMMKPGAVEELTAEIITTSASLAKAPIDPKLTASQRQKLIKSLLTQKRRAWSDLLKELKRAGLASNMKPEVLDRQRNTRWLRGQNVVVPAPYLIPSLAKAEEYMYRLSNALPELRSSLSGHHQDMNQRELQRGVMFVESGFSMALDSQGRATETAVLRSQLHDVVSRLCTLETDKVNAAGDGVLEYVTSAKDASCKLVNALEEMLHHLRNHQAYEPRALMPAEVFDELQTLISSSKELCSRLSQTLSIVKTTAFPVLLKEESKLLTETAEHIKTTLEALRRWAALDNVVRYHASDVKTWLEAQVLYGCPGVLATETTDSSTSLIDTLLISIQALLSLGSKENDDQAGSEDDYARHGHNLMRRSVRALNLDVVLRQSNVIVGEIAQCSHAESRNRLARILPFLGRYMELVNLQLLRHSEWSKALFKLDHIVCRVVLTLAKEGFCRPPDTEESGQGDEGSEIQVDGTGLGEGAGNENVSKDIQDESQVEGLQGDEGNSDEQVEQAEDDNAIEMNEDVGGQMQDVPDAESEEDGEDLESEGDPEEQLADLDASDPSAVDEKLWGDQSGPQDSEADGGRSKQDANDKSEMTSKEESSKDNGKQDDTAKADEKGHSEVEEVEDKMDETMDKDEDEGEGEEDGAPNGAPLDDHVQEADTLDLPDDMNLDGDKDSHREDMDMEDGEDVEDLQGTEEDTSGNPEAEPSDQDDQTDGDVDGAMQEDQTPPDGPSDEKGDDAVAQPDVQGGDGSGSGGSYGAATDETRETKKEADSSGQTGGAEVLPQAPSKEDGPATSSERLPGTSPNETSDESRGDDPNGAMGAAQGEAVSQLNLPPSSNPLRSLGDTLREISQQLNDIMDSTGPQELLPQSQPGAPSQMEYLHPDENDSDLQALGPKHQEDSARLNELKFKEDDHQSGDPMPPAEDIQGTPEEQSQRHPQSSLHAEQTSQVLDEGMERALTRTEVSSHRPGQDGSESAIIKPQLSDSWTLEDVSKEVELKLREWQADGQPTSHAGDIWRLYESLTHDLSYALCEQLRLILEPTQATRLKGDYRTGKRLNMKKIIPYIASEFTKDKIWLRRTRPSQREYQVLIALDDSRSMAESHSVHLAYETLALVSKALSRLEVGDIAIAKFGETVDVLHRFDSGPFTDQAGTRLMDAFRFDQKATQVLSLVETSLTILEQARERRSISSSTASDLWQLQLIISDGICQDHERLRTVLRKAEEQRVMIVFIILDSLHTRSSSDNPGAAQNSIVSMNQVAYKNVDGRMDLHVERYLDTFPFEYYLVLRDVEALPDVLSGTLKQFFERMAEQ